VEDREWHDIKKCKIEKHGHYRDLNVELRTLKLWMDVQSHKEREKCSGPGQNQNHVVCLYLHNFFNCALRLACYFIYLFVKLTQNFKFDFHT